MSLSIRHRADLESYAQQLADMDKKVDQLSEADLEALERACAAATTTNCWVFTFRAAQLLLPMIRSAKHRRSVASAATAPLSAGERQ